MTIPNTFPRVLILTSASDMGVDHTDAQVVLNFEFPKDISTSIQCSKGVKPRGIDKTPYLLSTPVFPPTSDLCVVLKRCHPCCNQW